MEAFSLTGEFTGHLHRSPVNSPHKSQWRGALMFSLICAWIKGWVSNGEAGDLRRHRAHYNVTVMPTVMRIEVLAKLLPNADNLLARFKLSCCKHWKHFLYLQVGSVLGTSRLRNVSAFFIFLRSFPVLHYIQNNLFVSRLPIWLCLLWFINGV